MAWPLFLAVWVGIGLVIGVVMGRHGHSALSWTLLGVVLGPLAVPLACDARADGRARVDVVASPSRRGGGPVTLVAGIDGSSDALDGLRAALEVLGDRVGAVRLVAVIDQDAATNLLMFEERRRTAVGWLAEAAALVEGSEAEQLVVAGDPVEVLADLAEAGSSVIAIGHRGRGLSTRVFGSVASKLAERSPSPVLIG